jgi:hypothetical protein
MSTKYHSTVLAAGLLLTKISGALATTHYVDQNSTNSTPPYTTWPTAATNIQDAVNAAAAGDQIVVTNGTYAGGASIDKPLTVRSASGPQFTTISGGGPCVSLASNARLSGFTVTGGSGGFGGGAYGGALTNCTLTGNSATYGGGACFCTLNDCTLSGNSADFGGGAQLCTLNNCTLSGNSAGFGGGAQESTLNNCVLSSNSASGFGGGFGGGVDGCTLYNCTLTGNSATQYGGGAWGESYAHTLNNCIAYFNSAPSGANYANADLNYCCTTPLPPSGMGNLTAAPLFVDYIGGNLRLQSSSPCINAGNNSYFTNAADLDGNSRISGGIVDIGAYEFQWPLLTIAASGVPPSAIILRWPTNSAGYAGYDYTGFTLQFATNLVPPVVWSTSSPAPVVVNGQNSVTNPITGAQQFYRLIH